jgi:hypothetical protein
MRYRPLQPRPSRRVIAQQLNRMADDAAANGKLDAPRFNVRKAPERSGNGSEHQEQWEVIRWWAGTKNRAENIQGAHERYGVPEFALFAIPNGGGRSPVQGEWLRQEGVRRGAPDLCLAVPRHIYHGAYVEMKYGDGRETEEQREFLAFLASQGYRTGTFWTGEAAIQFFTDYLEGR